MHCSVHPDAHGICDFLASRAVMHFAEHEHPKAAIAFFKASPSGCKQIWPHDPEQLRDVLCCQMPVNIWCLVWISQWLPVGSPDESQREKNVQQNELSGCYSERLVH